MRSRIVVLALSLLASSLNAFAEERVKVVVKSDPASVAANAGMKHMTFGLNSKQTANIRALTNGEIDLGQYYYSEMPESQFKLLSRSANFSGVIYPNVPPPAIQTPSWSGDPELTGQWWIESLKVPDAWLLATGAGVTIADCDAGFYHDEPDLHDNMLLDLAYDFSNKDAPNVVNDGPYAFHGTAVAAIMGGVKNDVGTNGIAFNSKIVPFQNYNYDSSDKIDKEEATAACILRAIDTPNVSVIVLENQMQNGSSEAFAPTRDAVRLAMKSGITVVGAGGNYSVELKEELADDTGSVIVGALNRQDEAASFTNFGSRLTVGAYGEQLHTLFGPDGAFGYFGGTSGATPQVAATVALMKEANPYLTPEQVRQILIATRSMTSDNQKAGGKLNLLGSVEAAAAAKPDLEAYVEKEIFRIHLSAILSGH